MHTDMRGSMDEASSAANSKPGTVKNLMRYVLINIFNYL